MSSVYIWNHYGPLLAIIPLPNMTSGISLTRLPSGHVPTGTIKVVDRVRMT